MTAMIHTPDSTGENVAVVERFLAAFDRRWPAEDELADLVAPDIRFTERPNLINPGGSERDRAAMRAGLEAGRELLAWQSYEVRDHVASGDTVVSRMRWRGQLAADAGAWPAGTHMSAWSWPTTASRRAASSASNSTTATSSHRRRRRKARAVLEVAGV